eukprot:316258_1
MDNTRTVEKLIILLDYTEGVLARLYNATQFRPGPELQNIPNEIRKYLLREIIDPTEGIWELDAMSQIQSKRGELGNETQFVYDVFDDLLKTGHEISVVVKHITNNILTFNLETNGDIVIRTFDLLANYIRMHLLAARVSQSGRLAVLVHSICGQQNNTHLVRKLLSDLREPYTLIRASFDITSCTAFATCLSKPAQSFSTWMNFEELKAFTKELFNCDPPTRLAT